MSNTLWIIVFLLVIAAVAMFIAWPDVRPGGRK